ncbi:hypothetical protein JCM10213_003471 [Rhodosporidiobolus nylandii]
MGLFHKSKQTSPSGFFTAEISDSEREARAEKERRKSSDAAARRRSSSTPRKSTSSSSHADAAPPRKSTDSPRSSTATGGSALDAALPKAKERGLPPPPSSQTAAGESAVPIVGAHQGDTGLAESYPATRGHDAAPQAGLKTEAGREAVAHISPSGAEAGSSVQRKPIPRASVDSTASPLAAGVGAAAAGAHVREHAQPPAAGEGHGHHRGLSKEAVLSEEDAKRAEHDHQYLEPVVHERRHVHEVEEVERHRVVDRHVHHVQHHVQPLLDERHLEVVHSYREVPVTHIEESHAATAADKALLARLNAQSASTYTIVPHERVRVDMGETQVTENVVHHYHTIVMPVWQRDLHEFYRLHSDFSPATLPTGVANNASPAVQAGMVPAQAPPSMMGPPQREGFKQVRDGESATYEVEYVNREPVVPGKAVTTGLGQQGAHQNHLSSSHTGTTVGGDVPSAREHYPIGAQGIAVREAVSSNAGMGGLERGVKDMELGVAK